MTRARATWRFLGAVLACSLGGRGAQAAELHEVSRDVHVTVDASAHAEVEELLTFHPGSSPFRAFDWPVAGAVESVDADAIVSSEEAHPPVATTVLSQDRHTLHVELPAAVKRGNFTFRLRYRVDLVASGGFGQEGALARVTWTSPPEDAGSDGVRVVFRLPPAITEPQPRGGREHGAADPGSLHDGFLSTLRRSASNDELELVRPHVSRGEEVAWSVLADPKAFPMATARWAESAPAPRPSAPMHSPIPSAALLVALALAVGALIRRKEDARSVQQFSDAAPAMVPLVPGPAWLRVLGGGGLFGVAAAVQAEGDLVVGSLVLVAAMLLTLDRPPSECVTAVRGPGRWLALRPEDAFAVAKKAPLRRRVMPVLFAAGVVATAFVVSFVATPLGPLARLIPPLDAFALMPLLLGTRAQRSPIDRVRPLLARLHRRLARPVKSAPLRVVPWARVASGASPSGCVDELRVLAMPRPPIPGLVGIEAGLAYGPGQIGGFEVVIRVADLSAAAAKLEALGRAGRLEARRVGPGRRSEERAVVIPVEPPTVARTERVVRGFVSDFAERRSAGERERDGSARSASAGERERDGSARSASAGERERDGSAPKVERRLPPARRTSPSLGGDALDLA